MHNEENASALSVKYLMFVLMSGCLKEGKLLWWKIINDKKTNMQPNNTTPGSMEAISGRIMRQLEWCSKAAL